MGKEKEHLKYRDRAREVIELEKEHQRILGEEGAQFLDNACAAIDRAARIGGELEAARSDISDPKVYWAWCDECLGWKKAIVRGYMKLYREADAKKALLESRPDARVSLGVMSLAYLTEERLEKEPDGMRDAGVPQHCAGFTKVRKEIKAAGYDFRALAGDDLPDLWVMGYGIHFWLYCKNEEDEHPQHQEVNSAELAFIDANGGELGKGPWRVVYGAQEVQKVISEVTEQKTRRRRR